MDIGLTFLYSFLTLINVFFYIFVGIISFGKRYYTQKSLKNLSELLINMFLPLYGIIEVSRMATPENMKIFWIMIISVIISMSLGYFSSWILQKLFKTDVRINSSFNLLCCVPSIGTLPLVLGKAFCFPGGPLEGDSQCPNILGYMMINYLVFQIGLFLIGFGLIANDANFGYEIGDKMSLTWHIICEKLFMKNYYVLYIFRKFFKNKKIAKNLFEKFDSQNKLIRIDGELNHKFINLDENDQNSYFNKDQKIYKNKNDNCYIVGNEDLNREGTQEVPVDSNDIQLNMEYIKNYVDSACDSSNKSVENKIKKINLKDINNSNIQKKPDSNRGNYVAETIQEEPELEKGPMDKSKIKTYFESRKNSVVDNNDLNEISHLKEENINKEEPEKFTEFHKLVPILKLDDLGALNIDSGWKKKLSFQTSENSSGFLPKNFQSDRYDKIIFTKNVNRNLYRQQSVAIQIQKNQFLNLTMENFQEQIYEDIHNFLLDRKKPVKIQPDWENAHEIYLPQESMKHLRMVERDRKKEKMRMNSIIIENNKITSIRLQRHQSIFDNSIVNYYEKIFRIVENNLDSARFDEFLVEKSEVMKNLYDIPPRFPIVRGIEINRVNLKDVESIWNDYLIAIKNLNNDFQLNSNHMVSDIMLIINKIHSPAVTGTILGLLIGVSGLRDILFSTNHYLSNLNEGILILTKATVPFLYVSVGVSFVSVKGLNLGIPVNYKHIIISFLIRFIIVPGFGIFWTWMWTSYYGGMLQASKVFRIALFIPFCVPSSANMVVIVNIIRYFIEEANIILVFQNLSLIVTLTILYVVYFITIGTKVY